MIAQSYILRNLKSLNSQFNKSKTAKGPLFYSKLAIVELCGWIEISQDDLVQRCADRCIKIRKNQTYITKEIIGKNYGFSYNNHFKKMIVQFIGHEGIERVEASCKDVDLNNLKSELATLYKSRNDLAHTYLKGVTVSIDAPMKTVDRFQKIYSGLINFEYSLKKLGY